MCMGLQIHKKYPIMDDNMLILYSLPSNQSAGNIAIFKFEPQKKESIGAIVWNRDIETILDLLMETPSIPRYYVVLWGGGEGGGEKEKYVYFTKLHG